MNEQPNIEVPEVEAQSVEETEIVLTGEQDEPAIVLPKNECD